MQVVYLASKIQHDNIEMHILQNYVLSSKSFFGSQRSQNSSATYFEQVAKSPPTLHLTLDLHFPPYLHLVVSPFKEDNIVRCI